MTRRHLYYNYISHPNYYKEGGGMTYNPDETGFIRGNFSTNWTPQGISSNDAVLSNYQQKMVNRADMKQAIAEKGKGFLNNMNSSGGGGWANAIAPAATNIANAFLDTESSTADRVAGALGISALANQWRADTSKGNSYLKGMTNTLDSMSGKNYIQDASSTFGANNAVKLNNKQVISPISAASGLPSLKDFKGNWWKNMGASVAQGAASGSVGGPWGALGGAVTGLFGSIGGLFGRKNRAEKAYNDFLHKRDTLMSAQQNAFNTAIKNQSLSNMQALANGNMSQRINDMANIRAYGGNLFDGGGDLTDEQYAVIQDIEANPRKLFTPEYTQWRNWIRTNYPKSIDRLYTSLPYEQQQDIYQNDREAWGALSNEAKGDFGGTQVRKKTDEVSPYVAGALGLVGAAPAMEAVSMFPVLENGLNTYFGYEGIKDLPSAIYDTYNYAKNGDWSNAGLNLGRTALDGLFLKNGISAVKNTAKEVLPVVKGKYRQNETNSTTNKAESEISDKDWDIAYNAAIKANDITEAQRLRDLHFKTKAGDSAILDEGNPKTMYHSVSPQYDPNFNSFNTKIEGRDTFVYSTDNKNMSRSYTKGKEIDKKGNMLENVHSGMSEEQLKEAIKSEEAIIEYQLSLPKEKQNSAYIKNIQSSLEQHKKEFYNKKNKVVENYDADNLSTTKSLYGKLDNPWIIEGNYNNWGNIPTKFPEYNEIVPVERSTREVEDLIQINNLTGGKKYDGAIMNNISDWGGTYLQPERDVLTLNTANPTVKPNPDFYGTVYSFENPKNLKYRDAITYDDAGNIIPLSKRDNFNINDLRYGLIPFLGLTGYGLTNNTEYAMGGNLYTDLSPNMMNLWNNKQQIDQQKAMNQQMNFGLGNSFNYKNMFPYGGVIPPEPPTKEEWDRLTPAEKEEYLKKQVIKLHKELAAPSPALHDSKEEDDEHTYNALSKLTYSYDVFDNLFKPSYGYIFSEREKRKKAAEMALQHSGGTGGWGGNLPDEFVDKMINAPNKTWADYEREKKEGKKYEYPNNPMPSTGVLDNSSSSILNTVLGWLGYGNANKDKLYDENDKFYANGGQLNSSDLPDNAQYYANGGTHEENPYGGIQVGTDQQGNPNLVEEGEFRWGDYIFSDRINVDPTLLSMYNLAPATKHQGKKANKGKLSYADMAKKYAKKNKELADDPIGKNTLEAYMKRLQDAQEDQKFQDQIEQQKQDIINQYRNALSTPQQGNPMYGAMKYSGMGNAATQQGVNAGMSDLGQQGNGNEVLSNTNRSGNNMLHAMGGNLFAMGGDEDPYPYYNFNFIPTTGITSVPFEQGQNADISNFKITPTPRDVSGEDFDLYDPLSWWHNSYVGRPLFDNRPLYIAKNNPHSFAPAVSTYGAKVKGTNNIVYDKYGNNTTLYPNGLKTLNNNEYFSQLERESPTNLVVPTSAGWGIPQNSTNQLVGSANTGVEPDAFALQAQGKTVDGSTVNADYTTGYNGTANTNTGGPGLTDNIKTGNTTTGTYATNAFKEDRDGVPLYNTAGKFATFGKGLTPMLYDWMNKTNTKYEPNQRPANELARMGNESTFLRTADTIGGYRAPNLMDAERMNNAAQAQGLAALQSAFNVANGNRGFAAAQAAQNAYNTQMGIGNNYATAQQANNEERYKTDVYNNSIDQFNANARNAMYQDNQKAQQVGQNMALDAKAQANDYILRNELSADRTNREAMENRAANQATWIDNALNYPIAQAQKNAILNAKNNDITNPYWTDKNGVMHYIGDSGLNSAIYDAFTNGNSEWGNYAVNNGTFTGDRLKEWNKLQEKYSAADLKAHPDLWKSLVLQEKQARKEEADKADKAKSERVANARYAFDNNMAQLNNYRALYGDKFTNSQYYDDLMKRYNDKANATEFNDINNLDYWNRIMGDEIDYWRRYNTPVTAQQSAYGGYINNNNKSNKRGYYNYMAR